MELNTLKFPPSVIANLYTKTLVTGGDTHQPAPEINAVQEVIERNEPITENEIAFLGENRQNILITVNHGNVKFLPDDELSFLTNMLTACKLNLADVAIINLSNIPNPSYKTIFEKFNSGIVLLTGTDPAMIGLPLSFPHFQVQAFKNNTLLFTPPLHEIQEDKILKSKLWVCLRRIFSI